MINITPKVAILRKGDDVQLEVTKDFEEEVKFLSSDPDLATVDEDGFVEAGENAGSVYITAMAKTKTGPQSATARFDVAGIMIHPYQEDGFDIKVGCNAVICVNKLHPSIFVVEAESSNEKVCSVSRVGATSFALKGIDKGKADVTFKLMDPKEEDEEKAVYDEITVKVCIGNVNSLEFKDKSKEVTYKEGLTIEPEVIIDPEDEEYHLYSDNKEVAVVEGTEVHIVGLGTVHIKARKYDKYDTCKIKVIGLKAFVKDTVAVGRFSRIVYDCTDKSKTPKYEVIEGNEFCSVDKYGMIAGVANGSAKIKVTVGDYSQELQIEVKEYFTPKEELTKQDVEKLKVFDNFSGLKAYAGARCIKSTELAKNVNLYYIKNNPDFNIFEYELAMITKELVKYIAASSNLKDETVTTEDLEGEDIVSEGETKEIVNSEVSINDAALPSKTSLKVVGEKSVNLSNIEVTGAKLISNTRITVECPKGEVYIKELNMSNCVESYNGIEIGLGKEVPSKVTIENCNFSEMKNNPISIFGMQEGGVITLKNCKFNISRNSNPLRLSNKSNAKNVKVRFVNCELQYTDKIDSEWKSLILCQDYTGAVDSDAKGFVDWVISLTNVAIGDETGMTLVTEENKDAIGILVGCDKNANIWKENTYLPSTVKIN